MRSFRPLFVVALILAVPAAVEAKGGKKKHHGFHGVVKEVKKDGDKDNGYIVVRHHDKDDKKGKKDRDDLRKFQVTADTKFFVLHEGKKEKASFKDVKEGQHVKVVPLDDRKDFAQVVEILKDPK
jgi:hypothetical protein